MAQPRRNLSVELRVVNFHDPHPTRTFVLRSPAYAIRIGRGSKSGNRDLFPASYNAWFDSRVMSREHAVLKADPDTRCVYIEDVGSMHGTYVKGRRIEPHERHRLYDDDVVKFGNEVTRGPESFPPLHVVVRYNWVDDSHVSVHARSNGSPGKLPTELPPNTFQVPDDDDEEDEDISFVHETVIKQKPELLAHVDIDLTTAHEEVSRVCLQAGRVQHDILDRDRSKSHSLPSFTQSSLNRSDEKVIDLTPLVNLSVANPGPSGLSEAERQADKRTMQLEDNVACSTASSKSAGLESPSKSSASLPTSPPSKQSDEHPNEKDHVCIIRPTSVQPTETKKRATVVDEDLTQSESDSDEAYSPDLMVDDSEDGQGHECLTDYGSEYDEESLMVVENRGTKIARVSKDSTDSESSRSELSDDIDMEREQDIFELPKSKASAAKMTYDFDHFDNHDKEPPGRDPAPYNMRPGNFAMPCTRLNLPSISTNRAPSPSDAALAKPCDFATGNPGVMTGFNDFPTAQPWLNPMTPAYGEAWPCTLDGRPNNPYEGGFGGYPYSYGANCGPTQYNSGPFRTFHTPMPMIPDQGFNTVHGGSKQPDRPSGSEKPQPQSQSQPPIVVSSPPNKSSIEIAHGPQNWPKPAAKVSINSIVENVSEESHSSQPGTKLKRKADEINDDDTAKSASERPGQVTSAENISSLIRSPQTKTITAAQIQALQNVPSTNSHSEAEPPAKRARVANPTPRTSFTTLAATALAGAVVGGVGVVAALVALPPDFFV